MTRFLLLVTIVALNLPTAAQQPNADDRERRVVEALLAQLEHNQPQPKAIEDVYGYHLERGTEDALLGKYRKRVAADPKDGRAWWLLGLFESQRGQYEAAADAFLKAAPLLPNEPLLAYHLGRVLALIGRTAEAATALERSVAAGPRALAPGDRLAAYQMLRRVYQQLEQADKATATLARVQKEFARDRVVLRQIAGQLIEEGRYAEAREILDQLAKLATDPLDRAGLAMAAADTAARQGLKSEAVDRLTAVLDRLPPESAIAADARRQLEDIFLRDGDLAGAIRYYEARLKPGQEDPDTLARLAHLLALQGRAADAKRRLEHAVRLAPNRVGFRTELIRLSVTAGDVPGAILQYQGLDALQKDNPETLRGWGELLLRDTSRPEPDRKAAASAVWRRIAEARPTDSQAAGEAAEVFARAGMVEEALAFYRLAVERGPDDPENRRHLGDYLLALKRPTDAVAAWREIATESRRTPANLRRLAELLATAGFPKEAVVSALEARDLAPGDFEGRLLTARLLTADGRAADALKELAAAAPLARTPEQEDRVVRLQIDTHLAEKTLAAAADRLEAQVTGDPKASARRWLTLARFREAQQQWKPALAAAGRARDLDPQSVEAWRALARVAEAAGDWVRAADAFRRLAEIDPVGRVEHLRRLTELSAQLGRKDQTLQAGQHLLATAPDPDHYQLVARAYLQVGATEEGLAALRVGVVRNPGAPQPLIFLAAALADRFRTNEAIALYWRAFEKTTTGLDDRLALVDRLAELAARVNKLDDLFSRLRAFGRSPDRRRESAFYLARAYQKDGRDDKAQEELDGLLRQPGNDQDPSLLRQLAALAEARADWPAAKKYQEGLVRLARTTEGQLKLAELLDKVGEHERAATIWAELAKDRQDARQVLAAVDNMLFREQNDAVLRITGRVLKTHPNNWEMLYREGRALARIKDRHADAANRFRAILQLDRPDDELSVLLAPQPDTAPAATAPVLIPAQERILAIEDIRAEIGLAQNDDPLDRQPRRVSAKGLSLPVDFRQARIAATGWLLSLAREDGPDSSRSVVERFRKERDSSARSGWDWFYLNLLIDKKAEARAAALALSRDPDPTARWVYLFLFDDGRNDLDHRLACYKTVRSARPDWLGEADRSGGLRRLHTDLRAADRIPDADALYKDLVEAAGRPAAVEAVLRLAAGQRDIDGTLRMWSRLINLRGSPTGLGEEPLDTVRLLMESLAREDADRADLRRLLDGLLAGLRKAPAAVAGSGRPVRSGRDGESVYPVPNQHFSEPALALLREAHELHRAAGRSADLLAHFRDRLAKAALTDRPAARLAIGYLLWWGENPPAALAEVTAAAKDDSGLRLEVADLLARLGRAKEALAEADLETGVDPDTVRRREQLVLQQARALGDDARARTAAARLAAIRLDPEETLVLVREMRRLKMTEPAEEALLRVLSAARGRPNLLAQIMEELLDLEKPDRAATVAAEIVRLVPAGTDRDRDETTRTRALEVLRQMGKLARFIAELEEEAARNTRYRPPLDTLGGLYRAEADVVNLRRTLRRIADLSPGDPTARAAVVFALNRFGDDLKEMGKDPKKVREAYEAAVAEWDDQHPGGVALGSDRRLHRTILTDAAAAAVRVGDRAAGVQYLKRAEAAATGPAELVLLAADLRKADFKDETRPLLVRAMELFATGRPEIADVFSPLVGELTAQGMADRTAEAAVLALRVDPLDIRRRGVDRFDLDDDYRSRAIMVLGQPDNKPRLADLIKKSEVEFQAKPALPPLLALEGLYEVTEDVASIRSTYRRTAKLRGDRPGNRLTTVERLNALGDRLKDEKRKREAYEAAVAEWDDQHPDGAVPKDDDGLAAMILKDATTAAARADDRDAALKYLKRYEVAEDDPLALLSMTSTLRSAGLRDEVRPLLTRAGGAILKNPLTGIEALTLLMDEYEQQALTTEATDVAVRLLLADTKADAPRRPDRDFDDRRFRGVDLERSLTRAAALVRKSGRLPGLIAEAEAESKVKREPPVLRRLGTLYRVAEDVAGLRTTLRRMTDLGRDVAADLNQFGDQLKTQRSDPKKVREAYEAAVAEWDERVKGVPVPSEWLFDAARACAAAKDLPAARKYTARAEVEAAARVKAEPDSDRAREAYVSALESVALIAREAGDDDEAARAEKQALAVYRDRIANPPKDRYGREDLGDRLKQMAEARQKAGDRAAALNLYEMRIQMFEKAAAPGQPDKDLFDALVELAEWKWTHRDRTGAVATNRKTVALTEQWIKVNATDEARGYREYALRLLSVDLRRSGDPVEAAEAAQKAIDLNRAWTAQAPTHESAWIRLGYALEDLARVRRDQRRLGDTRDLLTERTRLLEQALARNPDSTQLANGLSSAYEDLGRVVEFPVVARDAWRKALDRYEKRLQQNRFDDNALERSAEAHEWLGDLEDRLGNPIAAVEHCRKAVELKTRIARDKDTLEARSSLAYAHKWLGIVSGRAGSPAEAIAQFRKEVELREALLKEDPDSDRYKEAVLSAYHYLGDALREAGAPGEAIEPLKNAIRLGPEVRENNSSIGELPEESLASAISSLAEALLEGGDIGAARAEFLKALDAVEEAVKKYPDLPGPRVGRTTYLQDMGRIARVAGDFAEAEKWYLKAVGELEALDKEKLLTHPDDEKRLANARRELAVARQAQKALKDLAFAAKQPTREAASDLLQFRAAALARAGDHKGAIETAEALAALDPKNPENLFDTARCYGHIASLIAKGRPPAKLTPDEKAVREAAVRKALGALTAAVTAKLPDRRRVMTDGSLDALRAESAYRDLVATFASPSDGK